MAGNSLNESGYFSDQDRSGSKRSHEKHDNAVCEKNISNIMQSYDDNAAKRKKTDAHQVNEWLSATQRFFLRSDHAPLDPDFPQNLGSSICVFGRCKLCTVFGADGFKYSYFTIKPFNCGKSIDLYFPVVNDSFSIKANDIDRVCIYMICGTIHKQGINVDLISKIPALLSKAKWDKVFFDEYMFRWRLRIATEMYNFHHQLYFSSFNSEVSKRLIYDNALVNPHLKGKEAIFKEKWLKWPTMLLDEKSIQVIDYTTHCEKIPKLTQSVQIYNDYTQYFHYNGLLIDPKIDEVIPK